MAWCALTEQPFPAVLPGATASATLAAIASSTTDFPYTATAITTTAPEITTPGAANTPIPEGTPPLPSAALHHHSPAQAVPR